MKSVYLLRHAKSDWDDASLADIDRPLAERGRDAAPRMGQYMKAHQLIPDAVLVSGARRAIETWDLVRPMFDEPRVRIERNLYMTTPDIMLAWLRQLGDDVGAVMLIGHNPGFEELARRLARDGRKKARKRLLRKYPTAGLAVLRFDVAGWTWVEWGGGYLEEFVRPKDL